MATVSDWDMVHRLIEADGHYSDDPQVQKIVEYRNSWGGKCWGIIYPGDDPNRYSASEYIYNPVTIWEAEKLRG